jgi:hypothetical protein
VAHPVRGNAKLTKKFRNIHFLALAPAMLASKEG